MVIQGLSHSLCEFRNDRAEGWIATPVTQARNDNNVGCGLAIDKMSQPFLLLLYRTSGSSLEGKPRLSQPTSFNWLLLSIDFFQYNN